MILFLKFFVFLYIILNLFFSDFFEINDNFSIYSLFIFYFLISIFFNFYFNKFVVFEKFDWDILYKFSLIFLKTPNFFFNYIINTLKKIFHYLYYFKFRYFKNTTKLLYQRYFNNFFLVWRPLFKKTSYFGYYRSNRSKWIK